MDPQRYFSVSLKEKLAIYVWNQCVD